MLLISLLLATAPTLAAGAQIVRSDAAAPTQRQIRTADVYGDLYLPKRSGRAPAILLLGGSEGGLAKGAARQAAALAAHGYVVLHLSYFGSPGQPTALRSIPLDTFTRALDWLREQPEVVADRIGIIGTSKGAEAALLVATRHPELRIAVLGVPSSVVWPGIDRVGMVTDSSWTEDGKQLPFTPYGWTGEWKGIFALYANGLADRAKASIGIIPAERAKATILMICGEADGLWPSCPMAHAVETRLKLARYKPAVTLLAYPDAGHAAFGLPVDPADPGAATIGALGGTNAGNLAARDDGWPRVLAALDAALTPGSAR